ncbi:MAG: di-trans,poly-cis-decaprenylcistransferase [Epsilonproteobacteria bacterium]|nr:di-trans,poly-cis-decaprenylcistransferase [Campylobacterota bacterium]
MNQLQHLAIIMDGNGRWAKNRGKIRSFGHSAGAKKVTEVTRRASDLGIKYLTLYAFSTENWKRDKIEVDFLMRLFVKFLKNELENLIQQNVRFRIIGDISKFSKTLQKTIKYTIDKTKNNDGITQILALNYGSKDEIVRAIKKIEFDNISENSITKALDTSEFPDIDILLRTGGEKRLSNFLLWQSAYAELFFIDTLWPDFSIKELDDIISQFKNRKRRFGAI